MTYQWSNYEKRNGFVSNSSSTSFLVAFKPEEGNLNLQTFDFLLSKIDQKSIDFHKDTVKCHREKIQEEIAENKKAMESLRNYLCILRHCLEDKKANVLVNELLKYWEENEKERIKYYRYDDANTLAPNTLKDKVRWYENDIKDIDKQVEKLENDINLLKDLSEESIVCGWTEDISDDVFNNLMKLLVKDGRVIILKKTTN